jgi:hypothetical protein
MTLARELADTAGRPQVDKNLLINGSQSVWQRSTSVSGITTSAYHTADRWEISMSGLGTWTQSRSTDVPSGQGFGYSLKMDCTTADASPAAGDYLIFNQKIEGQNLQHLLKGTSSAKALTLSFWVKSNKTGTYIARLNDDDNTRNISKAYTIDTANTWEKKTITFEGDTTGTLDNDNASSLRIQWWLGAGSTYSSGTLATSWESITNANIAVGQVNLADSTSNEWYVTGIQLEVGEAATDFQVESFDKVYDKCLRYYEKSYSLDTVVGTVTFDGVIQYEPGNTTTGAIVFPLIWTKIKRDTPTFTYYDSGGNVNKITTAAGDNRTGNPVNIMEKSLQMRENDTASIAWFRFHYQADAEL